MRHEQCNLILSPGSKRYKWVVGFSRGIWLLTDTQLGVFSQEEKSGLCRRRFALHVRSELNGWMDGWIQQECFGTEMSIFVGDETYQDVSQPWASYQTQ